MKKIIEEVLRAEKDVNQIIQEAREKALSIKKTIDNEISEKVAVARRQAQEIIHDAVEQARVDTKKKREERLALAEKRDREFLSAKRRELDSFVSTITHQIISTGYDER